MSDGPAHGDGALDAILEALPGLSEAIDRLSSQLADVKVRQDEQIRVQAEQNEIQAEQGEYGRRNRHMIWGLVVLGVVSLVLVGGFILNYVQTQSAHDTADRAHESQVQTCVASNASRDQNAHLWETIITLASQASTAPKTPAQQQVITQFEAEIHKTFTHRDCSKI